MEQELDTDFWLTTNGDIIEVGSMEHNNYAQRLLEKELGFTEMMELLERKDNCSPYQILHKRGWVRGVIRKYSNGAKTLEFLGDCVDLTKPMRNTIDPAMNLKQLRIAKMICKELNTDFHTAINDKRFH